MRTVVAMSGGVDSSVAAALLRDAGHEVIGVTMRLLESDDEPADGGRGCCGIRAVRDAARVAARLGIPHYTVDFRQVFEQTVIDDFVEEYARGRTPNPCIRCNELVKFRALLGYARGLGAAALATGHYARIVPGPDGQSLHRARDRRKDQSYFLYRLTPEPMADILMPVGELTKDQVRARARELGLSVADKSESQEICFIPDDDYPGFLRRRNPEMFRSGPVLDTDGNEIGRHDGIAGFTVGQRRGLGLAFGERRYVVRLDPAANAVVLGPVSGLRAERAVVDDPVWTDGRRPEPGDRCEVQIRHQHPGAAATFESTDERVSVRFDRPQRAVTPGQAAVFYQGDVVVGGGVVAGPQRE